MCSDVFTLILLVKKKKEFNLETWMMLIGSMKLKRNYSVIDRRSIAKNLINIVRRNTGMEIIIRTEYVSTHNEVINRVVR